MATLKVLAALLHYPDEVLREHAGELIEAVDAEGLLTGAHRDAVAGFIQRLQREDLLDLQAEYVETFDRGRSRSLHLYEHVHGESRDRGQAMVELSRVYREHGFEIAASELPDYLPLFLEFLSRIDLEDALGWLEQVGPILQILHARLAERANPYVILVEPLVLLAGLTTDDAEVKTQVAEEKPDDTPQALDEVWMEEPVSFGPEGGCNQGQSPSRSQEVAMPAPTPSRYH